MFWLVLRHDLRLLGADRSGWIAALLLLASVGYGLWNGLAWVHYQGEGVRAAEADERRVFSELEAEARKLGDRPGLAPPFGPFSPGMVGLFYPRIAHLPIGPLEALSVGQTDVYPRYFRVSGHSRDALLDSQEIDNPINALSGRFDLAFVVVYLLPLVLIAISFGVLAADRESGTLGLALSQPVPLGKLLAGKLAARGCCAIIPLVVGVAVGAGAAGLEIPVADAALWAGLAIVYALFWLALCGLVNLTRCESRSNAVILTALWLAFVLVAPVLLNLTVQALHPAPSRITMIRIIRELQTETRKPIELLERHYRENPGTLPDGVDIRRYNFPLQWTVLQLEMERQVAPLLDSFDQALYQQQQLLRRLSFLSPALIVQEGLNDLSGTGLARQRNFWRQVLAFHKAHQEYFAERALAHRKLMVKDYGSLPQFRFVDEPASDRRMRVASSIGLLSLLVCGFLTVLVVRLKQFSLVT